MNTVLRRENGYAVTYMTGTRVYAFLWFATAQAVADWIALHGAGRVFHWSI